MKLQRVPVSKLRANPKNPRIIKDEKFQKLVQSIKDFPEMLELRPIVVDGDWMVLGGNMRLKACPAAGLKEVPVAIAADLTPDQQREFIIKDNVGFGEWQWDALANEWDANELIDWGLDVPSFEQEALTLPDNENPYTKKIEAPIYKITGEKPQPEQTYDVTRYLRLCKRVDDSNVSDAEKALLKLAAARHIVFDYAQMAELYAHSNAEMQDLMEESALVIIDFDKAIELEYAKITQHLVDEFEEHFDEHA